MSSVSLGKKVPDFRLPATGDQEIRLDRPALSRSPGGAPMVEFQPLPQPGTDAVQIDIVDPVSEVVLQRTTLRFDNDQ